MTTPLKLEGAAPLLLAAHESLTRDEAGRMADELFETLRAAEVARVLIASDDPAKLLVAIAAASRARPISGSWPRAIRRRSWSPSRASSASDCC